MSTVTVKGTQLKEIVLLSFFVLLKFILSYLTINPVYELHRDEYLYLDQANHPAAGYVSVPPLSACVGWVIQFLGNTPFWVKFFPILFGALTLVVCWYIIKAVGGSIKACIYASLGLIFSGALRIDLLFQPNSFDILSWTVIYFFLIKFVITGRDKWLLLTGVATGFALLNKYNVAFLILSLVPAFILTRQRRIFLRKSLYISLLIAFLIVLPNIIWQIKNHYPVVTHMHELMETQLVNMDNKDFIRGQVAFYLGSDIIILCCFAGLFFYEPFKRLRFIGWSYLCTIIIFLYFHGKDYYSIGLYPVLIALGAAWLELNTRKSWKRYILPAIAITNLALFVLVYPFIFPRLTPEEIESKPAVFSKLGLLKWEDGKEHPLPQDFSDMLGWKEMAAKTLNVYQSIPGDGKEKTLVVCDNYGEAGAINYYNMGKMVPAVSMNADYIYWFPKINFKSIIAIKTSRDTIEEKYTRLFKKIELKDSITNKYAREYGAKIYFITGIDSSFQSLYYSRVKL